MWSYRDAFHLLGRAFAQILRSGESGHKQCRHCHCKIVTNIRTAHRGLRITISINKKMTSHIVLYTPMIGALRTPRTVLKQLPYRNTLAFFYSRLFSLPNQRRRRTFASPRTLR